MKKIILIIAGFVSWAMGGEVIVAASLTDLASIAAAVGGNRVETFSIARPNANPHQVEVLPSYMVKVSRADVYLKCGLNLDQWADAIIEGSRNGKLKVMDCSKGIDVLEKPGKVDASMGDVHPGGNPHYWLNPANADVIAGNITGVLSFADPEGEATYAKNFQAFKEENDRRVAAWRVTLAPLSGKRIISYHSSWAYFANAFGLVISGYVEPFPGIPPTGKHLAELVDLIQRESITLLLQEPYFPEEAPQFLSRKTGVKVFKFTPSCQRTAPDSYWKHFDEMADQFKTNGVLR